MCVCMCVCILVGLVACVQTDNHSAQFVRFRFGPGMGPQWLRTLFFDFLFLFLLLSDFSKP